MHLFEREAKSILIQGFSSNHWDEAGNQELNPGLPHGCQELGYWSHPHCLPGSVTGGRRNQEPEQGVKPKHPGLGLGHSK